MIPHKIILIIFIVEFIVGAVVAGFERNWGMVLYFGGAATLNAGLILAR